MRHYQNTLTGEVVSEDEYSYAAAQKGNWVLYPKIPRYTIETPPYSPGRTEFDEDGKLCYWDDVKDIVRELEELKAAVIASLILLPKDNDGKRLLEDALKVSAERRAGSGTVGASTVARGT